MAIMIEIRDCDRRGIRSHGVIHRRLKGAVAIPDHDLGIASTLELRNRDIQSAILIEVSDGDAEGPHRGRRLPSGLECSITVSEEHHDSGPACSDNIQLSVTIEIADRNGRSDRGGSYAISPSSAKSSVLLAE